MELQLIDTQKTFELSNEVFGCEFNEALVHQVVTAYMAGGRAGTKAQKTRAEVSGGGIKPWRQKGTGRARAGTIRSPLWRKGGKVFAAKPRSYEKKVNKKMYRAAIRSIYSELIRQERLIVIGSLTVDEPKTKAFLKKIEELNLTDARLLIISDKVEMNLYLAARNLPNVEVRDTSASAADPVALVRVDKVLVTEAAIKEIEDLLK